MLDTIGHIALIVKNSSRTAALFKELFDASMDTTDLDRELAEEQTQV
jgi:hypothetical protein